MARIDAVQAGGQNVVAFLDMLAVSEIGAALLAASDDGYNVLEGSTTERPILFADYSTHPHVVLNNVQTSTAAGRYQLLNRYYPPYRDQLKLVDFGPISQDRIAIQQIKESRAFDLIIAGNIDAAVARCAHIWASLPGAGYQQHENKLATLLTSYQQAGGIVA